MMTRASLVLVSIALAACAGEGDSEPMAESDLRDAKPLGPDPSGEPTRHPILLAHGFNAAPGAPGGFTGVAEALRDDGHDVREAKVQPFQSVEVRAETLALEVDRALADGAEKVNIIAHSMGGLDSRYLISELGYGPEVASLTTMSTPHRGSAVADQVLAVLDGLKVDDQLINDAAAFLGRRTNDLAADSDVRATMVALSEAHAIEFNQIVVDDPSVFYQSWAGVSSVGGFRNDLDFDACDVGILGDGRRPDAMDPLLVPLAAIVAKGELIPNDGVVAVESARWGNFRGCLPGDHIDEVGSPGRRSRDRRTGFDPVRFYRNVAFELAEQGF